MGAALVPGDECGGIGVVHSLWLQSHVMSGRRLVFVVQLVQRGHVLPLRVQQLHRHLMSRVCQEQRETLKEKLLLKAMTENSAIERFACSHSCPISVYFCIAVNGKNAFWA